MQYQIFVQNPTESHFMASVIGMPACVAEGTTEAEVLDKAQVLLEEQLAKGKIVTVNLPSIEENSVDSPALPRRKGDFSTLPGCGIFKDDPTFDDFVERMAEFRARFNVEVTQ
jgi:predicted RNase H-like HicB family nuclease